MHLSFRPATVSDISAIMEIEASSFEPGIREKKSVFLERIHTFPDGFILLCDSNKVIGYLCAEIWNNLSTDTSNTSDAGSLSEVGNTSDAGNLTGTGKPAGADNMCEAGKTFGASTVSGAGSTFDAGNLSGTGKPVGTDNTFEASTVFEAGSTFDATMFTLGHSASSRHVPNGSVLYISSTGILPSYRGLGLGKQLFMTAVSELCRDYSSITTLILLVNEKWLPARKVYNDAGFIECARLNDFFCPDNCERQNGIVMIKKAEIGSSVGTITSVEIVNSGRSVTSVGSANSSGSANCIGHEKVVNMAAQASNVTNNFEEYNCDK